MALLWLNITVLEYDFSLEGHSHDAGIGRIYGNDFDDIECRFEAGLLYKRLHHGECTNSVMHTIVISFEIRHNHQKFLPAVD